jgi:hypothetical protein
VVHVFVGQPYHDNVIVSRPPPNLLRQEVEGTQLYLLVLHRACGNATVATPNGDVSNGPVAEAPEDSGHDNAANVEEEKLRQEAERRLVTYYGHILQQAAGLQPGPNEAVQADVQRALILRSPVTVKVAKVHSDNAL